MSYANGWTGEKYDGTLTNREVAQRIRADIKQAKKDGKLPKDMKVTVRSDYRSIDVTAIADNPNIYKYNGCRLLLNDEYEAYKKLLTEIHDSYNFDYSDPMTDFFHTGYYGRVTIRPYEEFYGKLYDAELALKRAVRKGDTATAVKLERKAAEFKFRERMVENYRIVERAAADVRYTNELHTTQSIDMKNAVPDYALAEVRNNAIREEAARQGIEL